MTDLLRLSQWTARTNGTVERLLIGTYARRVDPRRRGTTRRTALAERLLSGLAEEAQDDHPELRLAPAYLVVVLCRPGPAPEGLPRGTLDATVGNRTHLLVPLPARGVRTRVRSAVAEWARTSGVLAAGEYAERPAAVAAAAATARRLLTVAEAVGTEAGLVPLRDLTLETSIPANPSGMADLGSILDQLDTEPRLLDTLTTFFAEDLDRARAASVLRLSRGGLSLRLERIARLTGLDPRTTRGIQVLGSALSARVLLAAGDGA